MSLAYQIRGMTGAAPEVHLNGTIGTGDSSFAFAPGEGTGWPTANIPAIIDYDNGFAEKVIIGTRSGVNCTGVLRGEDNTTAKAHSSGAKIRHVGFAQDFIEANALTAALTTKGDSLWKGGTLSVAPARLAAGPDQQIIRYKTGNALGVETTWLGSSPVYTSTANRDAAITAPSAGQESYLDSGASTEGPYFYNGTSWRLPWNMPWGVIGVATKTAAQNGISTATDITSLSVAFTAVTGRRYRTSLFLPIVHQNTAASIVSLFIADGASATIQQGNQSENGDNIIQVSVVETISAGAVTRKGRISVAANTIDLSCSATSVGYILVEDIGASGAPT